MVEAQSLAVHRPHRIRHGMVEAFIAQNVVLQQSTFQRQADDRCGRADAPVQNCDSLRCVEIRSLVPHGDRRCVLALNYYTVVKLSLTKGLPRTQLSSAKAALSGREPDVLGLRPVAMQAEAHADGNVDGGDGSLGDFESVKQQ
jgi:hypothetical protein